MTLKYWRALLPPAVARRLVQRGRHWLWTGATNAPWRTAGWGGGYGYVWHRGRAERVHRVVWRALGLPLAPDEMLLHGADCPRTCANPSCLRAGDANENNRERWAQERGE